MLQLDSIDVRALVERSLGKGWSFSASGRRSYFDVWLRLLAGDGVTSAPKYYDYQLMVRKELGRDHDVRFTFFGSDDRVEIFSRETSGGDFVLGGNINARDQLLARAGAVPEQGRERHAPHRRRGGRRRTRSTSASATSTPSSTPRRSRSAPSSRSGSSASSA